MPETHGAVHGSRDPQLIQLPPRGTCLNVTPNLVWIAQVDDRVQLLHDRGHVLAHEAEDVVTEVGTRRPSASCDAAPRKGARRGPDTARRCAAARAWATIFQQPVYSVGLGPGGPRLRVQRDRSRPRGVRTGRT